MDTKKYIDMAYTNTVGRRWLDTLHREDIWNTYVQRVNSNRLNVRNPDAFARKILLEAIWHLGFTQGVQLARCARRLRREGMGRVYGDRTPYDVPPEFAILDEFLEYYVRPLI